MDPSEEETEALRMKWLGMSAFRPRCEQETQET